MRKSSMAIFAVIGLMTAIGLYWFMSPGAVLERRWPTHSATIRGKQFACDLVTKRIKTKDRQGRSSPYDTLEYEFIAMPATPISDDQLKAITNARLELWFFDDHNQPVIEPLTMVLDFDTSTKKPRLSTRGKEPYPSGLHKAKMFVLQENSTNSM